MKLTLKVFLVVCLFSSIAFADGDMGNGGFADGDMGNGGKSAVVKTGDTSENVDGDMGNGGRAVNDQNESAFTLIQKYLISLFG